MPSGEFFVKTIEEIIEEKLDMLRDFYIVNSNNKSKYLEMFEEEIKNIKNYQSKVRAIDRLSLTIIEREL